MGALAQKKNNLDCQKQRQGLSNSIDIFIVTQETGLLNIFLKISL